MSLSWGDIWCADCGAEFREQCHCPGNEDTPAPEKTDRWVGVDGHAYVGDSQRPSSAWHDTEHCRCPQSPNFDPESWY